MSTRIHRLLPNRLSIGIWCLSFPCPPPGQHAIRSLECTTSPGLKLEQALCGAAADLGDFVGGTTSPLQQFQGSAIIHREGIIGAEQQIDRFPPGRANSGVRQDGAVYRKRNDADRPMAVATAQSGP